MLPNVEIDDPDVRKLEISLSIQQTWWPTPKTILNKGLIELVERLFPPPPPPSQFHGARAARRCHQYAGRSGSAAPQEQLAPSSDPRYIFPQTSHRRR